jgi:hypothetical protein
MKFNQFIQSILPSFGKDQVLEDCRLTLAELRDVTVPIYASAEPLFKSWKFKTNKISAQLATFDRMVKTGNRGNYITVVNKSLKDVIDNLEQVEELIKKGYAEEVAGAGLTYFKANLLQFVECCGFVSKYARKYLLYIYIYESANYTSEETTINESMTKAELEWLDANFVNFCTAFNAVAGNPSDVKRQISNVPEIIITSENGLTLGSTIGVDKLDPFNMGLIPLWMNPIYHVGMFVAEWQASRYKAAKEELRLVQLRKLHLEKLVDNKPDAAIEKEISYMETRVQGLNYKIAKMEEGNE